MGRFSVSLLKFPGPAPAGSSSEVSLWPKARDESIRQTAAATSPRSGRFEASAMAAGEQQPQLGATRVSSSSSTGSGRLVTPFWKGSPRNSNHPLFRSKNCCVAVFTYMLFPTRRRKVREGCKEVLGHLLQAPRGQGYTPTHARSSLK
jgi:hypothetical protein